MPCFHCAPQMADEAVCIGEAPSSESYLNVPNLLAAAVSRGAQAVHPVSTRGGGGGEKKNHPPGGGGGGGGKKHGGGGGLGGGGAQMHTPWVAHKNAQEGGSLGGEEGARGSGYIEGIDGWLVGQGLLLVLWVKPVSPDVAVQGGSAGSMA